MENLNPQNNTNEAVNNAIMQIESVRQEVNMMGANDYEIPTINDILKRLKKGEITAEKALEEVYKIEGGKCDYH
jgi:hypothetical protein